jgi:hypothetical protein
MPKSKSSHAKYTNKKGRTAPIALELVELLARDLLIGHHCEGA